MSRVISNPDVYRTNIVLKLKELITAPSPVHATDEPSVKNIDKFAINIEKSVYNYSIREATTKKIVKKWTNPFFVQIYEDRLRSIYRNLKTNKQFVERIFDGEISPEHLSNINHIEMAPEQWKELIDLKVKKDMNKFNSSEHSSTDLFQCRKCKSRHCQYYELQVRSSDEPMTIFVNCLDCGKHWKQN